MRIQVNGRYLHQRVTGMQRYAREIVSRLADAMDVIQPRQEGKGVRGHLWEQMVLPSRLNKGLLWSPSTTGPLAVKHQVVTIHDTAFVDQPQCFTRAFAAWYQYLVPRLARRVRKIITVSNFSKERIADYCRIPLDKIVAIHSGVDPRFQPVEPSRVEETRQRLGLPAQYVLFVGNLEPRKNLLRLLQAWHTLPHQQLGLSLVLVGTKQHVFRDIGLTEPPQAVHFAGYLDDADLPTVYSGAEMFVFPSIYEGFGFPVLEAMACGVPVVCSNNTSLPEVAGTAAHFIDPYDIESIADGILRVAQDETLRATLREAGLANAKRFTWQSTIDATWRTFEEAA